MKYGLGIDFGGTLLRAAIIREDGEIIRQLKAPTTELNNKNELIAKMVELAKGVRYEEYDIKKVGVAICGPVEPKEGIIYYLPNVKFEPFSLKEELEKALNIEVELGNDANVAAFAESKIGFGKGKEIVQFITISTGIGGGLVIDGKIIGGKMGMGQEIGHMHVLDSEFEKLCSGTGIPLLAKRYELNVANAKEFFDLVTAKDELALKVFDAWLELLSTQIANMVYYIAPDIFVFGGGVMKSRNLFFDELISRVENKILPALRGKIEYKVTYLDQDLTVVGAGLLGIK